MLDSLMLHLEEFECTYLGCRPRIPSIVLWTAFLLSIGAVQSLFLRMLFAVSGMFQDLFWTWLLLALCLSISLAIRWQHSIPAHFLFGNIAGQLVVLRRKTLAQRLLRFFLFLSRVCFEHRGANYIQDHSRSYNIFYFLHLLTR